MQKPIRMAAFIRMASTEWRDRCWSYCCVPGDQGPGLEQVLLEPAKYNLTKYKLNLCTAVEDKLEFCMHSLRFSPSFWWMYTNLQMHTQTSIWRDAHRQLKKWWLLTQSHVHTETELKLFSIALMCESQDWYSFTSTLYIYFTTFLSVPPFFFFCLF